jgi:hypothetical protein
MTQYPHAIVVTPDHLRYEARIAAEKARDARQWANKPVSDEERARRVRNAEVYERIAWHYYRVYHLALTAKAREAARG